MLSGLKIYFASNAGFWKATQEKSTVTAMISRLHHAIGSYIGRKALIFAGQPSVANRFVGNRISLIANGNPFIYAPAKASSPASNYTEKCILLTYQQLYDKQYL